MENLEKVKKWCEENKFSYEEDIDNAIFYIKNKLIYEGFSKGKRFAMSMIEIMNMRDEYLEQYLNNIKIELHTFNQE